VTGASTPGAGIPRPSGRRRQVRGAPARRIALVLATCLAVAAPGAAAGQAPPAQRYPTAHCYDGTYYYGKSRSKACAHHRGVAEWLAPPPGRASPQRSTATARRPATRAPAGATARCKDGTYSFVRRRAAACARHGGIARWLRPR
jgi:hypothetical protein